MAKWVVWHGMAQRLIAVARNPEGGVLLHSPAARKGWVSKGSGRGIHIQFEIEFQSASHGGVLKTPWLSN
jgi:hypothetical protein